MAEEKRKYYIVWNGDRTEGFVTDEHGAALNAHHNTGEYWEGSIGRSTLGIAFAECYREDDDDIDGAPDIEEVELEG